MTCPWVLAIEIGGTKLQVAAAGLDGSITALRQERVDRAAGAAGIRSAIVRLRDQLESDPTTCVAAGIGFGGPVDTVRGLAVQSLQVQGWDCFPLEAWARDALGLSRVALANDSDAAALAEALVGAGRGFDPVLYVNSGSGVGGGLIVGGRIYRGGSGLGALEIGHLVVEEEGSCWGVRRTLEEVASGWGMEREAREQLERVGEAGWDGDDLVRLIKGRADGIRVATMAQAAQSAPGGPCGRILERGTQAMGRALAQAITLLAPQRVVMGGGVSLLDATLWLDPIARETAARVFPPFRQQYQIVPAALAENVVVQGAALLACERVAST